MSSIMGSFRPEKRELFALELRKTATLDFVDTLLSTDRVLTNQRQTWSKYMYM